MLNVLDLFSGIGGFSLGLERTGHFRTVAFCEQDRACQNVLKKHWPDVPVFNDVRSLSKDDLHEPIDVITGGFPCQDISNAGRKEGLSGERSGLWWEFHRLIDELRPRITIIENVSTLRTRGLEEVLRSLDALGYDAEWHCIPASSVGAPHSRDRIWIIAYPHGDDLGCYGRSHNRERGQICRHPEWNPSSSLQDREQPQSDTRSLGSFSPLSAAIQSAIDSCEWPDEPPVARVAHGVPGQVDSIKQLGNAVVPYIPELLGRALI